MKRGQIWWCQLEAPDKRRPVVVLTRSAVVPHLTQVTVAPVTSRIRGLPTEVAVGPRQGLGARRKSENRQNPICPATRRATVGLQNCGLLFVPNSPRPRFWALAA